LAAGALLVLIALCGTRAWCDAPAPQFTEDVNDTGKDAVVAARTEAPPKIDGALDDECWKTATRLTTFRIVTQPGQGLLAAEPTEVLVTSDEKALYFAFICHDGEPAKIAAHQTQYDGSFSLDDEVLVGLDTFCDKTRSYEFEVNPLGTRHDARWDDGRWNATWPAAAKIGADGWTVEMAIPFSILTMPKGARKFGFNCGRFVQRKSEWSDWKYTKNYSDRQFTWAELSGFEMGATRRPDRLLAYVVGSQRLEKPTGTASHMGFDWEHALTSTATAMLTVNPDWNQIEAAHAGIDFTYVERVLPEVRPFFVESAPYLPGGKLFSPQGRLRRFEEGLKVTGTEGRFRFGVLEMLGVERFEPASPENDLAMKLWYDFSHETYFNVSEVHSGTDDCAHYEFVHEHKGAVNMRSVAAFYHQSSDQPGLGGSLAHLQTRVSTEKWSFQITAKNVGDNFRPALGYTDRAGYRDLELLCYREFNPKPGAAWFETAEIGGGYTRADDHTGGLKYEDSYASLYLRQSAKLSAGASADRYRHPGPTGNIFDDLTWNVWTNICERQPTSASVNATIGTIEESGYQNYRVGGAVRSRDDRLAGDVGLEWTRWTRRNFLSLHGPEEDAHQYTLGAVYRLGKHTSFALSERWLTQGSESRTIFNAVLHRQYGMDHDLYVVFGDPQNPNETVRQVTVKYVRPL
jgi:hypothetical protein